MSFKTLSPEDVPRVSNRPLDYEWDATIGNGFSAANEETHPRLVEALERLDIHGATDLALGAAEWCIARAQAHVPAEDGLLRLQSGWAASVDGRYSNLAASQAVKVAPDDLWSRPEWRVRRHLTFLVGHLEEGRTSKVRQIALGMILLAEHLCGRDARFGPWLAEMFRAKTASSPRHPDDHDDTFCDRTPSSAQELTLPSREARLAGLNPATNRYLRSEAEMAALGFVGNPYPDAP